MAAGIFPFVAALRRPLLANESSAEVLLDYLRMEPQDWFFGHQAFPTDNVQATAHVAGAGEGTDMRKGRSAKREDLGNRYLRLHVIKLLPHNVMSFIHITESEVRL